MDIKHDEFTTFLCHPKTLGGSKSKSIDGTDLRFHTVYLIANPILPWDFYQNRCRSGVAPG